MEVLEVREIAKCAILILISVYGSCSHLVYILDRLWF